MADSPTILATSGGYAEHPRLRFAFGALVLRTLLILVDEVKAPFEGFQLSTKLVGVL